MLPEWYPQGGEVDATYIQFGLRERICPLAGCRMSHVLSVIIIQTQKSRLSI